MQSISSLLKQLKVDYPNIIFVEGTTFHWDPSTHTITAVLDASDSVAYLLHELAHATLGHDSFDRDIRLLTMEREAWSEARSIAHQYSISIDSDLIEDSLDTYRDWLHERSVCPSCSATGVQTQKYFYVCVACYQKWTVNDARTCRLRRLKQKYTSE